MVRLWAQQPPVWLTVEHPHQISFLDQLNEGEASALSLAMERRADAVLIDERKGTSVARSSGLAAIGTLAFLQEAGHARLLDFHASIRKLAQETRFRHRRDLIDRVIADYEAEEEHRQK